DGPGAHSVHVDRRPHPATEQRAFSLLDSDERARWSSGSRAPDVSSRCAGRRSASTSAND
ncbi:MAG: hypothetical protein OXI83_04775, partial [Gemmatimonadota bacterium]|nr:hypothetical protein [Gemmatimonadota bacterium]